MTCINLHELELKNVKLKILYGHIHLTSAKILVKYKPYL